MSRWTWLTAFAISCGQPAPAQSPRPAGTQTAVAPDAAPPRSLADDLPRLATRARQLYLDWAAAFADPNMDCATATARTNAIADKYDDVSEANRELRRAGHERIKAFRAELDKYDAEIGPAARTVMESPVMGRCVSDAAFARAMERLAGDG